MLLTNKVVVITGAGSGVGRASARRFGEEGAAVVCADIDLDSVKETVAELEAAGSHAVAERCDVSEDADVAAAVASAVGHFGRLDVMFNNVGIPTPRLGMSFEEHTLEDFERLTAVNFRGVFLGCKHAVVRFKEQGDGGVILNTGSVAGLVGWGGTVYGATKGAVHQLTRHLARRLAPAVTVNAIAPGLTVVEATEYVPAERHQLYAGGRAMTRAQVPGDVCGAVIYLLSDAASFVTGQLLAVNGGFVMH